MRLWKSAAVAALFALSGAAQAADEAKPAAKDEINLTPMSADRSVRQSVVLGGRKIDYTATVGHIDVRDAKGKVTGQVVFTAYTVPGAGRPVTFAFNGGPGAASVYLNLGAIGPKRVQFGGAGDAPSDSAVLRDNPGSWIDFTDLVFIDPVGTGFSRSLVSDDDSKKAFYNAKSDIEYLSRVVYDWLTLNGRMTAKKYLVGESYGGYRVPRLAYQLQTRLGVGLSGIVMVSPYLDPGAETSSPLSPTPYMISLPSMAAANLERQGKLSAEALRDVEAYTRGEFATDLLRGTSDRAAVERLVQKVSAYTGLDPAYVRRLDGRVEVWNYLREIRRGERKIGSVYDSNVTAWDPFPGSEQRKAGDPILDALLAPTTSAMVDFVTRQVGWKTDTHYEALSYDVGEKWDMGKNPTEDSPVTALRQSIAIDSKMQVMIVHGFDDLSCPYFASMLIVDQMPAYGVASRVRLARYPGGHMFYSRPDSSAAFRRDAMALFGR